MRPALALSLLLLAASCGWRKQHLAPGFGASYDGAFAAQRERSAKPPAAAILGLDSQEAAITSDNYRAGLAPKGEEVKPEPTVILTPASRERPPPLAPSVPKE